MAGDWVRLHRKVIDSQVFSDHNAMIVWVWCLCRASYKVRYWQGQKLEPGEFVTGRMSGASECQMSDSTFYRTLKKLESWGNITLKVNSKWTTVSICQWRTYQHDSGEGWTADEQHVDSTWTADEQHVDTNKKDKKDKKGRKKKSIGGGDNDGCEWFISLWNSLPGVVEVRQMTEKRLASLRARMRDKVGDKMWRQCLEEDVGKHFPLKCFSNGEWKPDVDWILKPDSVQKVIEGKYDWTKSTTAKPNAAVGAGQVFAGDTSASVGRVPRDFGRM